MTDTQPTPAVNPPTSGMQYIYDPDVRPELFEGILSKRIVAFFVDAIIIVALLIPASLVVLVLGLVTLGIGWLLFPALFAIVALGYVALTMGGPRSATLGQQFVGIEMRTWNGQKMFALLAVMHALVFWFSVSLLTPLILLVGLFTRRKQMLHDLLLGVLAVNADPLRPR